MAYSRDLNRFKARWCWFFGTICTMNGTSFWRVAWRRTWQAGVHGMNGMAGMRRRKKRTMAYSSWHQLQDDDDPFADHGSSSERNALYRTVDDDDGDDVMYSRRRRGHLLFFSSLFGCRSRCIYERKKAEGLFIVGVFRGVTFGGAFSSIIPWRLAV